MKKFHNKPHNFDCQLRLFQKPPCTINLIQSPAPQLRLFQKSRCTVNLIQSPAPPQNQKTGDMRGVLDSGGVRGLATPMNISRRYKAHPLKKKEAKGCFFEKAHVVIEIMGFIVKFLHNFIPVHRYSPQLVEIVNIPYSSRII